MNIYIVRHTSVDVNGLCYGQTDVPLKDTFEKEAEAVKQKLKDIPYDAIYSSPLSRCRRLAEYCGYKDIQLYDRLKEMYMGDWEMKDFEQIEKIAADWDIINTPVPNGESLTQVYKRVESFLSDLKTKDYSSVIIFAHGGIIKCFQVYFGKSKLSEAFNNMAEYGEVFEFNL